ncbi:hypothetical protein HYX02_02925 [Candidatus Woesearchaeota archaeon]|nr:hypothetical protein [Candidatus Woesearchaeota archaeon]
MVKMDTDKKLNILKQECKKEIPEGVSIIEDIYEHLVAHPNQERDTKVFFIKKIIEKSTGGE